jgi:hypothetical protein
MDSLLRTPRLQTKELDPSNGMNRAQVCAKPLNANGSVGELTILEKHQASAAGSHNVKANCKNCGGCKNRERVSTTLWFDAAPLDVWKSIVTFEEVSASPPLWWRAFLPVPVSTKGDKSQPGNEVICLYRTGALTKKIMAAEKGACLRFVVTHQKIGIEQHVKVIEGSYRLKVCGRGTEVALTTVYRSFHAPRWMWKPLESFFVRGLHRHILKAMLRKVQEREA